MANKKPTKRQVKQLFAVHASKQAKSERLLRSYGLDSTRSWVDPNGHRLSDRIWNAREETRKQIDQVLRLSLASGDDALKTAKVLEQYLNPEFSPVRNEAGRLVRNQRRSIVTRAPGRGGAGSTSARRLARTEISRAHSSATIWSAQRTPFVTGVRWTLSGRHPKADDCNSHAEANSGLGPGVYPANDAPTMPQHPNCLCHWEMVSEEDDASVIASLRNQYGLNGEVSE